MNRDEEWLLQEKYGGEKSVEYEKDKARLACGEPLAYVIGWQPFIGLKIYLDSKPLIPRTETEWWTERLAHTISGTLRRSTNRAGGTFLAKNDSVPGNCMGDAREEFSKTVFDFQMLDLCAGSGAIGCALLSHFPTAHVSFAEIDPAHKATIEKNIRENNLDESRTSISIGDLFEPLGEMQFDVIAANPPYIPAHRELAKNVSDYEPSLALFSGDDGLDIIRRIAKGLPKHLAPNGIAWIECDEFNATTARQLFEAEGFFAEILNDQYDKPRVIIIKNGKGL